MASYPAPRITPVSKELNAPTNIAQRRAVRGYILFTTVVCLALALAWRLREVLQLVYVSALFAVVLMPVVNRIQGLRIGKYRPSRFVAIIALMLSVVLFLFFLFFFGLPPVLRDIERFTSDLPQLLPQIVAKAKQVPLLNKVGVDNIAVRGEAAVASVAGYIVSSAPKWLGHVFDLVTALILCIYFMLEGESAYLYFLAMVPIESRDRLSKALVTAEGRMSKWLLGQGSLMIILGVCSTVVFGLLHVRYFFLLGSLMGIFNIIPVVGGVITILLAAGTAALDSWSKMAGVLIFYLIYAHVENGFLTPRIMKTSVNLMGLTVLIALLMGTAVAGVVGALVSVPTAALVAVFVQEYLVQGDAHAQELQARSEEVSS